MRVNALTHEKTVTGKDGDPIILKEGMKLHDINRSRSFVMITYVTISRFSRDRITGELIVHYQYQPTRDSNYKSISVRMSVFRSGCTGLSIGSNGNLIGTVPGIIYGHYHRG